MKRLRLLISTIVLWLFLLYNMDRLSQPFEISSVIYSFLVVIAILTILVPRINRFSPGFVLGGLASLFLVLKVSLGHPIGGSAITLTFIELSVVVLTGLLARQINYVLDEFEQVLRDTVIETVGKPTESLVAGQGNMYREVRRARSYRRPLSLMAVGIEEKSLQNALPRIVLEAQQAMQRQIALSRVAQMLDAELEEHHIIAKQNNHFIALLPEVADADLEEMENQLRQKASEQMGLALKIGASSLSDEVLTFERLVKKASIQMVCEKPLLFPQETQCQTSTFLKHKGIS